MRVVGVSVMDQLDAAEKFVAQKGDAMGYTVAFDGDGKVKERFLDAAGQDGIPCSFVIDRKHRVVWIGHPMAGLDDVVAELAEGTFDLEVARALRDRMQDMDAAYQDQDWAKMAKLADELLKLAPTRAEGWAAKLFAAQQSGAERADLDKMVGDALKTLVGTPAQLRVLVDQVVLGGRLEGDYSELTLTALDHALAKHPDAVQLAIARVRVLDAAGKTAAAGKAAAAVVKALAGQPHELAELAQQLVEAKHPEAVADAALAAVDGALAGDANASPELTMVKFQVLAFGKKDIEAATKIGGEIVKLMQSDVQSLNEFTWNLLTADESKGRFTALARTAAEAMTKCDGWEEAAYMDTVALAWFENGKIDEAIELQKKAIDKGGQDPEYAERLERYQKAKREAADKEARKDADKDKDSGKE